MLGLKKQAVFMLISGISIILLLFASQFFDHSKGIPNVIGLGTKNASLCSPQVSTDQNSPMSHSHKIIINHTDIDQDGFSSFLISGVNGDSDGEVSKSRKKICIVSVDTRPLERFSDVGVLENMTFHSVAAYNSLFYALQHGYDYIRVVAPPIPDYNPTWVKISQLYAVIDKYDIIVCFDPDVYVRQPNVSIEHIMKIHNFSNNTSFLMAVDPGGPRNQDGKGRTVLNMGFIIAQKNNLTKEILKDLALCPEKTPNCSQWKHTWSHEQRAFSEYFRDRLKMGSELIIMACDDFNGFDVSGSGCHGKIVTHAWTAKHTMIDRYRNLMIQNLMLLLEREMWNGGHVYAASTSEIEKMLITN